MDAPIRSHLGLAFERGFRLEALTIEPSTGEVAGPAGREKLDPKVMGVLVLLAARAGHVVSREDLHEQLWPNAVVTDDALTRCIHELRRQLSRSGGEDRYRTMIETLPKRGYRLNGAVGPLEPAEPLKPSVRRYWLAAGAAVAVLALVLFAAWRVKTPLAPPAVAANSIAVLPFADMSEAQDQGYFADGIAEEILNRLAKSGGLRVISRTSSFSFRGDTTDIPTIAAKLGVSHVLEGSVRRSGNQVRITAQLISAADNSHVWSETYDHSLGDLLNVQNRIAESVAATLHVTLVSAPPGTGAPAKPEAYELFLQGRFFFNRRAPGDIERAIQYFRESLALDPSYARAWAALAGAYNLMLIHGEGAEEELRPLQGEAAMKAVELDPGLAAAHARLAQYYYEVGEHGKGAEHFARARALDPNDALVMGFSADQAVRRGDSAGATEIWRRLVERNPLSPTDRNNYAHHLMLTGQFDEATTQFRKALELNPEVHWTTRSSLLHSLVLQRRFREAQAEAQLLPAGLPRDSGLALLADAPGGRMDADAALERLLGAGEAAHRLTLAEAFALRGMTDDAFRQLTTARREAEEAPMTSDKAHERVRWLQLQVLRSPFLMPLQADPRWQEIVADPK